MFDHEGPPAVLWLILHELSPHLKRDLLYLSRVAHLYDLCRVSDVLSGPFRERVYCFQCHL